jgi:LacI family transcriptional regulator
VHTLAGVPTTAASPRDHRHQYGLSFAVPDVNGTSYWGGRTFLPDVGSTLLANHGRQVVVQRMTDLVDATAVLRERLRWEDEYGDTWLSEQRQLAGSLLPDAAGWALSWRSTLSADVTDITFASPATNGRHGAGYGGIFWRLDTTAVKAVFSAQGSGEQSVHGCRTPWVAFVRQGPQGSSTVILQQPSDGETLPWFCRVSDYTGACPAIAWDAERRLPFGSSLELGLNAVLLDREVAPDEVPELLATLS